MQRREGRMASIELVVGKVDGFAVIPLTLAWANILKADKGVDNLKSIVATNGVPWDKVIYAQIEMDDPDYGFSITNLLDR
jgi:hypothetical protein